MQRLILMCFTKKKRMLLLRHCSVDPHLPHIYQVYKHYYNTFAGVKMQYRLIIFYSRTKLTCNTFQNSQQERERQREFLLYFASFKLHHILPFPSKIVAV